MATSKDPVHVADRHLEEAQAYIILVRSLADNSPDQDWRDARLGLLGLARRIEHSVSSAREALDEA